MFLLYILAATGTYCGLTFLFQILRSPVCILKSLILPNRQPFSKRYGSWAVITGSSDGIGKQYALNLANMGLNLFLISRTKSKLTSVAQEIQSKHSVEVRCLAVDFSEGSNIYNKIREGLSGLEVGILVNNVGMAPRHPCTLDELSAQELEEIISVNMQSTIMMTHMLLPEMKRRGRGLIVNLSSAAALMTLPYAAMYASTKAYLSSLTSSLQEELRGTGVECQLVVPLFIATNINEQWKRASWYGDITTNVEKFTRFAVFTMGRTDCTTGYWEHGVQITLLKAFPQWIITALLRSVLHLYRGKFDKS